MSGTTYASGDAVALVAPGCVLLLPVGTDEARVAELWPLVRDGADLDVVLEGLVVRGLRGLGPFALLHGRRLVLRGNGCAELGDGGRQLTGAAVTTWAEHALDAPGRVTLRLDDAGGGTSLPVVAAVVRAAAVTVPVEDAAPVPAAVVAPEPEPEREPEPEPQPEREPEPEPEPETAPAVVSPARGRLRVSDGTEVLLDRTVLIGRAPTVQRPSEDQPPHLLRVTSPQQDVSRTHVEVRVEGGDVLVVDLSSNGTWLTVPGAEQELLPSGKPVPVLPGSLLELGDGVTVTYEAAT